MPSLDVKRFYIRGLILKETCPICGKECTVDMGHEYLSYPDFNNPKKPVTVNFWCQSPECDDTESFEATYDLKITMEKVS